MLARSKWYEDPLVWVIAGGAAFSYFTSSHHRLSKAAKKCKPINGTEDWFVDMELRPDIREQFIAAMDLLIPTRDKWKSFELSQAAVHRLAGKKCDFREIFDLAPEEGQVAFMSIVRLADERLTLAGF